MLEKIYRAQHLTPSHVLKQSDGAVSKHSLPPIPSHPPCRALSSMVNEEGGKDRGGQTYLSFVRQSNNFLRGRTRREIVESIDNV